MSTWTDKELLDYHRSNPYDHAVYEERLRRDRRREQRNWMLAGAFWMAALFLCFSWYVSLNLDGDCLGCGGF